MIKHIIFIISILVLTVVQTTLSPFILPRWFQPDLLLVTVILLGLFREPASGSFYAFGIGYLQDLMTGSVAGLYTFERSLIYMASYFCSILFYTKNPWMQALLAFLFGIADYLLIWILSSIFTGDSSITWQMFPRSIASAIAAFLLYAPASILWEGGKKEF